MAPQPSRFESSVTPKKGTVLYIHGGGLFFGSATDLPQEYIRLFNSAGFDVIALPYPFAPEHSVTNIVEALKESIQALGPDLGFTVLFGRSAGGFLAVQLQSEAIRADRHLADAIICLYGYADMSDPAFSSSSQHFLTYGNISASTLARTNVQPADFTTRFSMYVAHRQRGTWRDAVGGATAIEVTPALLAQFPPTFLAASIYDEDVPFRNAKAMAAAIPESEFVRLYDTHQHDFDRDPHSPNGLPIYQRIVAWLNGVANSSSTEAPNTPLT